MANRKASRNWEKYGALDPYFGVLSHDKFHSDNLSSGTIDQFFSSGDQYIQNVLNRIKVYLDDSFAPDKSLDFGCGVGRLLIPISRISTEAHGIDVSPSMLEEAKTNLGKYSIENVSLIESEDCRELKESSYDFVHSFIVFQHIPVKTGMYIFTRLLAALRPGGIGVLHFTFYNPRLHGFYGFLKKHLPFLRPLKLLLQGRKVTPEMQMNEYEVNEIFKLLSEVCSNEVYVEFTDHDGNKGAVFYFKLSR